VSKQKAPGGQERQTDHPDNAYVPLGQVNEDESGRKRAKNCKVRIFVSKRFLSIIKDEYLSIL
jgi:hypothetical protein